MPGISKTVQAEDDLIGIWLYTYKSWSEEQADKYLDGIEEAIKSIADNPLLCRLREEFSSPVRIRTHMHHLIVYDVTPGAINILRVLHESVDTDTRLYEGIF